MAIRRGRPTHFKMDERSKQRIRESKLGHKHSEKTKLKISEGNRKLHKIGAPIDILMNTDLSECGKTKVKTGYIDVYIPNPIVGEPTYRQRLHVALIEQRLGRKLEPGEEIHHWGAKDNNNIKLLTLCRSKQHHHSLDITKANIRKELFGEIPSLSFWELHKSKSVIVNGIYYSSLNKAAKVLGVAPITIKYRVDNKKYGYSYASK